MYIKGIEIMDKKTHKVTPEVPYRRVTEIQTTPTLPEEEKTNVKKHPELLYGGATPTDVLGSYTGIPENRYEKPVQDADDL